MISASKSAPKGKPAVLATEPSCTVYVGNLPWTTTDEVLKTHMEQAGDVVSAKIEFRGKRSMGYGLVEV